MLGLFLFEFMPISQYHFNDITQQLFSVYSHENSEQNLPDTHFKLALTNFCFCAEDSQSAKWLENLQRIVLFSAHAVSGFSTETRRDVIKNIRWNTQWWHYYICSSQTMFSLETQIHCRIYGYEKKPGRTCFLVHVTEKMIQISDHFWRCSLWCFYFVHSFYTQGMKITGTHYDIIQYAEF